MSIKHYDRQEWKDAYPRPPLRRPTEGSVLPPVSDDNNGAFLRVVDGAYALVNLTDVSTEGA